MDHSIFYLSIAVTDQVFYFYVLDSNYTKVGRVNKYPAVMVPMETTIVEGEFSWSLIPSVRWYELLVEYNNLKNANQCPDCMYIIPIPNHLGGIVKLNDGIFDGAILHLEMKYCENYPNECPEVILKSNVKHPLVENGNSKLDVKRILPKGAFSMSCVLNAIKRAFFDSTITSLTMEEYTAFGLNLNNEEDYNQYSLLIKGAKIFELEQ